MSSLPSLSYKCEKAPFTNESFVSTIQGFVSKRDMECIKALLNGKSIKRNFIKEYNKLQGAIENALLHYRAERLNMMSEKYALKDSTNASLNDMCKKAVYNPNPKEAEEMVLDIYWKALDELSLFHFADFLSICVYALKLHLLERKTTFNKQKGQEEANRLFSSYDVLEELLK